MKNKVDLRIATRFSLPVFVLVSALALPLEIRYVSPLWEAAVESDFQKFAWEISSH
jgi:hypothetical protein